MTVINEVEHVTFVPIVMSATGGLSKQATNLYKRLASLLADKWEDQPYSTSGAVHPALAEMFSLLRQVCHSVQCIRGARSSKIGVTPTSGEVRLGKIPFSARGSPILGCRTAANNNRPGNEANNHN